MPSFMPSAAKPAVQVGCRPGRVGGKHNNAADAGASQRMTLASSGVTLLDHRLPSKATPAAYSSPRNLAARVPREGGGLT